MVFSIGILNANSTYESNIGGCPSSNDPYSLTDGYGFYSCQCTSYVAWKMNKNGIEFDNHKIKVNDELKYIGNYYSTINGATISRLSHAGNWDNAVSTIDIPFDNSPRVGDIAVWEPNTGGTGWAGHVAYVESINSDGSVNISEYNFHNFIGYGTRSNVQASHYIHVGGNNLNIYDFWIRQGTIYTNSKFDAQFKLKNNSDEAMEVSAIALALHDSNHEHKKDLKVDYGVHIGAGQSYSTGFSEITTQSEAGIYYVIAKYEKDDGTWIELGSQKIDIKASNNTNEITRAKSINLILDKFNISTENAGFNSSRFGQQIQLPSDVTQSTSNYDAIVVGYNRGVTNGENGKFYPTRKVSLQEFITMIVRTIPIPLDNPNYSSYSYADSSSNFYKYLKAAHNAKILENKSYNFEDGIDESTASSLLNKAFEYFRGDESGISIYLQWSKQYVDLDMYAYSPADSSNIEIEKDSNGYITNMSELGSYNNLLYYGKHSTNWGANLDYDSWGGNGSQPWAGFGEERATVDSLMVKRPGEYSFIICYYDWGDSLNPSSASYEMIGYKGSENITQNGSISGTIQKNKCKIGGTLTTN
jgi:surface antigen